MRSMKRFPFFHHWTFSLDRSYRRCIVAPNFGVLLYKKQICWCSSRLGVCVQDDKMIQKLRLGVMAALFSCGGYRALLCTATPSWQVLSGKSSVYVIKSCDWLFSISKSLTRDLTLLCCLTIPKNDFHSLFFFFFLKKKRGLTEM